MVGVFPIHSAYFVIIQVFSWLVFPYPTKLLENQHSKQCSKSKINLFKRRKLNQKYKATGRHSWKYFKGWFAYFQDKEFGRNIKLKLSIISSGLIALAFIVYFVQPKDTSFNPFEGQTMICDHVLLKNSTLFNYPELDVYIARIQDHVGIVVRSPNASYSFPSNIDGCPIVQRYPLSKRIFYYQREIFVGTEQKMRANTVPFLPMIEAGEEFRDKRSYPFSERLYTSFVNLFDSWLYDRLIPANVISPTMEIGIHKHVIYSEK